MRKKKPDHISQKDWDSVDVPEWTEATFRRARPAREVFPNIDKFPKPKTRGPQKAPTKVQTSIRLDREIVEHFRGGGSGWQSRVNETLKRAMERERRRGRA